MEQKIVATGSKPMRHLHLYAHLLLEEARRQGTRVRLEWADIKTANITPDPETPKGLLLRLSRMAETGSDDDAVLLRALIAHEVLCHGNHTDFSVPLPKGIEGALVNVIEDPRGELKALRRFPGSKRVIREGIEVLANRGIFAGPEKEGNHPARILTGWLVTELRSELLGQSCLASFAEQWRKLALVTFGVDLVIKVKGEALKAAHAEATQDVADAAKRIIQLLRIATEQPDERKGANGLGNLQRADSGPGAQGDTGTSSSSGPASPRDSGEQGDGSGDAAAGVQGVAGGTDGGETARNPLGTSGGVAVGAEEDCGAKPSRSCVRQAIESVLAADECDIGSYGKGLEDALCDGNESMQQARDKSGTHTREMSEVRVPKAKGDPSNRAGLRIEAQATAATLALKMEELLEAMSMVLRAKSCEGKLLVNRVYRSLLGDLQVFQKRTRQREIDTCVYVLGDESGSMANDFDRHGGFRGRGSSRVSCAISKKAALGRVAVAVGDVLDRADVPFGFATYNTSIREWKAFEDDWSETLTRYTPRAGGSTNTHLAVVWGLRKFIERNEARKLLLVVTDGDPGDRVVLEAAIREAANYGVEVRFVLIGAAQKHLYGSIAVPFGVANSAKELASSVFGALESVVI